MIDTTTAFAPTTGLDRETKQKIRTWVLRLRHLLQDDIRAQLRRYGIEAGKAIAYAPDYLTDDEKCSRQVIVAAIQRDAANERSTTDAITAYIRESAYTFLNRIVGLKCMEERGILFVQHEQTEVVTTRAEYGERSRLLWTMREEDRAVRQDETRLWREGLVRAFRAVTVDIALLFDPESEWSQVWPTQKTLMEAIRAINSLDDDCSRTGQSSVFASPDFLGWIYQFFNVEEKEQIREETGGKPRTSHELAVINQFYTPDWIVKFLVDNTLGRVWLRMHPDSRLRERINYLVPNTGEDEPSPVKLASELKLLDPACGTMHMGQYAFGLLYEMYLEEQEKSGQQRWPSHPSVSDSKHIPSKILCNNLYGIDIDPRAIQIAALTLLLTLKEQAKAHGLDPTQVRVQRMNLVCADPVNLGEEQMEEFIASLDPAIFGGTEPLRRAVRAVWLGLKHVAELGSLIQVGEEVERALQMPVNYRIRAFGPGQDSLDSGEDWGLSQRRLTEEERTTARQQLERALAEYTRQHLGAEDINQRLFAQETEKAIHLLDILTQKYDAVVMNPPYGEFIESAKDTALRLYPKTKNDIYAAFMERGAQILDPAGYVGALTSRTFLNLSSFTALREDLLLKEYPPVSILDLGFNVLDGAMVETAATILAARPRPEPLCAFVRLTRFGDERQSVLEAALLDSSHKVRFDVPIEDFSLVPSTPFSYWASGDLRHHFVNRPALQPTFAEIRQGFATGDDGRFIRQFWEVTSTDSQRKRWVGFAKGGDYSRFYSDVDLVLAWWQETTLALCGNRLPSRAFYFREALTFPRVTVKGFNVRQMPEGCVFADKGPAVFTCDQTGGWYLLGLLNSTLVQGFLLMLTPSRSFEVGHVQRLPFVRGDSTEIGNLAKRVHDAKAKWDSGNETSTRFERPWLLQTLSRNHTCDTITRLLHECLTREETETGQCQQLQAEIDALVFDLYEITESDRALIEREIGNRPAETVWPQMEGKSIEQKSLEHVLRLLSYFVKSIVEADEDGIVPLVSCIGEDTLIDQVREELDIHFGADRANDVESEMNNLLGRRTNVETWLAKQYFKYHTQLHKKRPIFWHIASEDGSFGVIVHYHRFNYDRLQKLRSVYLHGFIQRLQSEIGRLRSDTSAETRGKVATWEQNLESARALDEKLRQIQEGEIPIKVPWKSAADQPKGWRPVIDDGVKVNIGPFEAAGVLAIKKVV